MTNRTARAALTLMTTAALSMTIGLMIDHAPWNRTPPPPAPRVNSFAQAMTEAGWAPVTQELGDALAEGEEVGGNRDWESCFSKIGDTTFILCPDGAIFTS